MSDPGPGLAGLLQTSPLGRHRVPALGAVTELDRGTRATFWGSEVNVLASNWLIFSARGGVALLLALGIAATGSGLYVSGFVGTLGLFCDSRRCLRRHHLAAGSSVHSVRGGGCRANAARLRVSRCGCGSASALLIWVALRAIAVEAIRAWTIRDTLPARDRRPPLIGTGLSAGAGLGFLIISAFGYDALDLYACIAGNLTISGAT